MELVVQASIVLVSEICEAALGVRRARSHGRSCAAKVNMMLFVPFFPLYKPISFLPQGRHSPAEKFVPATEGELVGCASHLRVLWEKMTEQRLRMVEAKRKFNEFNIKDIKDRWKMWDEATIDGYRLQFRVIDLNDDGLIDFQEFCQALNDLGDTSSEADRRQCFEEVDADQSDGVDFLEFLELTHSVQEGRMGSIGKVYASSHSEIQNIMHIGRLSLVQQIKKKLF